MSGIVAGAASALTSGASSAINAASSATTDLGRFGSEGAKTLTRFLGSLHTTIGRFPKVIRFPILLLWRVCTWVYGFFSSSVFLWTRLWASIALWVFLGANMYVWLYFEQSPEPMVHGFDILLDIFRVLYNFFAGAWNFFLDLATPLIPLWNLFIGFVAQIFVSTFRILGEMVGLDTDPSGVRAFKHDGAGFDMSGYLDVMVPIVRFFCRIIWVFLDVFFIVYELFFTFLVQILVGVVDVIEWTIEWGGCCAINGGCCVRQIAHEVVNGVISLFLLPFTLLMDIEIFGWKPFKDLFFFIPMDDQTGDLEEIPIQCSLDDLMDNCIECKCSIAYGAMVPCQPCVFSCHETGDTMNWIKDCPSDSGYDNCPSFPSRVTIVEEGWCSADPPEGKGPKPNSALSASFGRQYHETFSDLVENQCYQTCWEGRQYQRCAEDNYAFRNSTMGKTCGNSPRSIPKNHHYNHDFNTRWKNARTLGAERGDGAQQCKYWMESYDDDTIRERSIRDQFHYDMCVVKNSMGVSPAGKKKFEALFKFSFLRTFEGFGGFGAQTLSSKTFHHPRLVGTIHAIHEFTSTALYHVRMELLRHRASGKEWRHFSLRRGTLSTVHVAWKRFEKKIDGLNRHNRVYRRLFFPGNPSPTHRTAPRAGNPSPTLVALLDRTAPRGGGIWGPRSSGCRCYVNVPDPYCEIKCPDGSCAKGIVQCPEPEGGWQRFLYEATYFWENLKSANIGAIVGRLFSCWTERTSAQNPMSPDSQEEDFVYCFPQWDPRWDLRLPLMTFDLEEYVEALCQGTAVESCVCERYDTEGIFDYDSYWFFIVPRYVYARAYNAFIGGHFLLTHYLTADTLFDRLWTDFFDFFLPGVFPPSVTHFLGTQPGQTAGMQWICLFLHLGSLLYTMFWSYFGFVLYLAYFEWARGVWRELCEWVLGVVLAFNGIKKKKKGRFPFTGTTGTPPIPPSQPVGDRRAAVAKRRITLSSRIYI